MEIYFSSSNNCFDHGGCGDFFLTNAFAFPQPLILFSNGDISKLEQLLQITEGWLQVNGLEKSNLEAEKIGQILDRMMIA